jgi:hypothetical protein
MQAEWFKIKTRQLRENEIYLLAWNILMICKDRFVLQIIIQETKTSTKWSVKLTLQPTFWYISFPFASKTIFFFVTLCEHRNL